MDTQRAKFLDQLRRESDLMMVIREQERLLRSLIPTRGHQIGPGRKSRLGRPKPSKSDRPGYIKPYIWIKNPKQEAAFHYKETTS